MLWPRIMKLHRYIDHDWQMTPINFQVTSSARESHVARIPYYQMFMSVIAYHSSQAGFPCFRVRARRSRFVSAFRIRTRSI
ncbi:hypothetical protein DPMN_089373 [Dreissena polymorpha]|uniref:Uncharacterized protein n=1 Tax=Dreissena polymorpha TaxID=45954 RepID=A0A9D4KY52_DREPO|nr:hypothetical protein DPMN_089373 [Dreissena polymorpha]